MLDDFSVLDPKQVVERKWARRGDLLRQHKDKVALSHETTRGEVELPSFLGHARDSIPQPGNSIADLRGVLRIVSAFNKLLDAIEAQRDITVSLYVRTRVPVGLRLLAIADLGGTVDLGAT